MAKTFVTSYEPLWKTPLGRDAVALGARPFVDRSVRREPDFESSFPSITALCRGGRFAPRLYAGSRIVYLTQKAVYPPRRDPARLLVAVLEVVERFETHQAAAAWYCVKGVPIPSNCMVEGNPPVRHELTNRMFKERPWNREYESRARAVGTFLACKAIYLELDDPPVCPDATLEEVFGRVPGTQNPASFPMESAARLLAQLELRTNLSG